ncbi:endoribonuclease LACTB2 [Bombus terrestris]|uniref:Beta-lactamase-like protein 2 homolog n=1 Tax=Bombus terrestris TaxID=30195 RepID=A0A9B7HXE5_BOMTE|nr:endoribonuclease LACTB2 [Bombus terrestris]XP_020721209.2 endoribonuclease LACTB2 [Bombus terrestris]
MKVLTDLPLVSRLSSRVIRILGCNKGILTLQGTNTYLVGTGTRRILIDAGEEKSSNEYTKVLREVLEKEKATIQHLLITHYHHDHLGGVNYVLDMLKAIDTTGCTSVWKLPRASNDKNSTKLEMQVQWENLKDKQIVEVEGAKLRVEYTPGHASDHACFMLEDEKILFSGDCVLGEGTVVFEDLEVYLASLRKMLGMQAKMIYPGHGPVIEDPESVINYYIKHRLKRENDILDILQQNAKDDALSEADIAKLLNMNVSKHLWEAVIYSIERHLEKLVKEGKVKGEKGKWQSM